MALKSFILSKSKENLSTGYDKRRKLVDGGDEITDSLFFYPIVGLVYQVNKLTREQLNDYLPKTIFYALSPDSENSFDISRLSTEQKSDSMLKCFLNDNSGESFILKKQLINSENEFSSPLKTKSFRRSISEYFL